MSTDIQTIPEIVRYWAEHSPDVEVFIFVNKHGRYAVYTTSDVYSLAGKFASRLRQYGFSPGDVIANGLPNSPERLITDIGIILAGCVMVNCQVLERDGGDFWNSARLAGCKGIIISTSADHPASRLLCPLLPQSRQTSGVVEVSIPQAESLRKVVLCSRDPTDQVNSLIASLQSSRTGQHVEDDQEALNFNPDPDDLAVLFATSGSSGFCKLVPRSHKEILAMGKAFQGAKNSKYFSDRPFGWMGGFPFDYLAHCSPRILQDMYGDDHAVTSRELWDVIGREKCTGAAFLPLHILDLVHEFKDSTPEFKLSFLVTGGQPLKQNLTAALGLLADVIVFSYASTETAMVCVGIITSAGQFQDFYSGQPMAGLDPQIKIVDEQGNELGAGQTGEILVKSPLVMKGYYGQTLTSEIFTQDGFFRTGDRGSLDEQGRLYCYGRAGDVFTRSAALIYASWPESILSTCPDLADVLVIGLPDDSEGQKLCACAIPKPGSALTENGLLDFYNKNLMTSRSKTEFKPLKIGHVCFFERFPETQSGKVNKKELKKQVLERLQITNQ